jgi:hypothetical protein
MEDVPYKEKTVKLEAGEIFEMTGIDSFVPIVDTMDEALKNF